MQRTACVADATALCLNDNTQGENTNSKEKNMQVLKNILFGLMHGFILLGSIAAVELIGIFWLAKPVGEFLKAAGVNDWVVLLTATACMIAPIALFAWKVLMPYIDWLEPELRRREAMTCKICKANRQARAAR